MRARGGGGGQVVRDGEWLGVSPVMQWEEAGELPGSTHGTPGNRPERWEAGSGCESWRAHRRMCL